MSSDLMEASVDELRRELERRTMELRRARRELEARDRQLLQAQKMEVIGNFTGGIAHDFNNIVLTIGGYATMVLEEWPEGHPGRADVEEIVRSAEKAHALTRQLLAFARKEQQPARDLSLAEVVEGVDQLLRRSAGPMVTVRMRLRGDSATVRADANQIQQVLLNLVVNARDAMPNGGEIGISVDDVTLPLDIEGVDGPVPAGDWVLLRVEDNGAGMDEKTCRRALEPFFTTKPEGRGTGLGLFIVHDILRRAGAHMSVATAPGAGTTFDLYFPRG